MISPQQDEEFPEIIQVIKADTDGLYYNSEDLEWLCEPTEEDPGILGPKQGAKPWERIS